MIREKAVNEYVIPALKNTWNEKVCAKVINALEQQTCEDAISRQAVLDCFKKWQPYMATRLWDFEQELLALPPVTPQPKMGHWIDMGDFEKCSACNGTHLKEFQNFYGKGIWVKTNYCPNCGAKMEVEE